MTQPFIPFSAPYIGDEEIAEVVDTLKSGWLTTGKKTALFEQRFNAAMNGNQQWPVQSIAVSSATAGLHLALEACGVGQGDKVIVPTMTFTATAEVVRYLGAEVVLVDVDPDTLCMDVEQLREAVLNNEVKAVMPVHYAGSPCDIDALKEICDDMEIHIVEDAAHAFPSYYKGKIVGSHLTDATVFSFYANKTMTTGEGGMVVSQFDFHLKRMKTMRLHGIDRDAFDRFTSSKSKPSWYYEVVAPGFKYNLSDVASSIGIHQLRRAEDMAWQRRNIAKMYMAFFEDLPLKAIQCRPGDVSAQHLFVIQLERGNRDELVNHLLQNHIGCSVHYLPLHMQPYWADRYKYAPEDFPVAKKAYENMVSLPLYSNMQEEQIQRVIHAVRSYFK